MMLWPFSPHPTLTLGTCADGFPLLPGRVTLEGGQVATHKHVMGLTGQGKSKFLASLILQLVSQGIGCCLIDPHGDLASDILRALLSSGFYARPEAFQRLWFVDFSRKDRYLPLNLLAPSIRYDANDIAEHVKQICERAWPALAEGAAPRFENILLASVVVLVQGNEPITSLHRLLTDKPFRDQLLTRVSDPQIVSFFLNRFDSWGRDTPEMIESTLNRVFLLTFNKALRYSLGQSGACRLDFRQLLDDKVSLIADLSSLNEASQRFLGNILSVGFENAALSRVDLPEHERHQYHLFMDEFSMFSAQSEQALSRVLSLARKYGLFLTMAHQTFQQVEDRLRGALQNATKIAFKLGDEDAPKMAPLFTHYDPLEIKHEVVNPIAVERTHPVFWNVPEVVQTWSQALQETNKREAWVKIAQDKQARVVKIKTLTMDPPSCTEAELQSLKDQYAELLQTAAATVIADVDQPIVQPSERTVIRRGTAGQH